MTKLLFALNTIKLNSDKFKFVGLFLKIILFAAADLQDMF